MKLAQILVVCAGVAGSAWGQKWEVGGSAGGEFYTSQNITSPTGSASANIQTNLIGSVWLGNDGAGKWGGELRYDYGTGNLHLSGGGTSASFAAHSQAIHYDVLWNFFGSEATIQPFIAGGAGIKIYTGTGTQVVYQPLSNVALLTQARDLTPMASVGAGLKFKIAPHVNLRVDIHDYLTPFPKQVITPVTGKTPGWLQDIVPAVGISFVF